MTTIIAVVAVGAACLLAGLWIGKNPAAAAAAWAGLMDKLRRRG